MEEPFSMEVAWTSVRTASLWHNEAQRTTRRSRRALLQETLHLHPLPGLGESSPRKAGLAHRLLLTSPEVKEGALTSSILSPAVRPAFV